MSIGKKRFFIYILMIICALSSIKLIKDILILKKTDERFLKAEEELKQAQMEQQSLKAEIKSVLDGLFWEKQVRNKLMMAKPNEVLVLVPEEINRIKDREITESETEEKPAWRLWWELLAG